VDFFVANCVKETSNALVTRAETKHDYLNKLFKL